MKEKLNLEKLILDVVLSDNYQPLKLRGIAKKIKLPDEEREVKRTIKRLIKKGKLAYGPKHLVMRAKGNPQANNGGKKPKTKSNEVIGLFRRTSGGFGFVTPKGSTATDRSDDIFIPKTKTADAADRDIVKISISDRREGKFRKSGRIIDVVERNTHQFVGTYKEAGGFGIVVVDGGVFESGILVGDAGAKNCRIGDKVVIEMANFPSNRQDGEGVIVEVLGDRGQPGIDTLSVIRQFGLPEGFSEAVLDDARKQADAFEEEITDDRTDFTEKTVITIDPKTARDFDDAISLEKLENGHWELGVHIADVSHFVPYRSALDNEAFARGTSVYLPDRVIPMIPEIISNNLASLQPNRVRYCMSALIEFTDDGIPVNTELHRGAIKSVHRFNYEEIDEYLLNDRPWKKKLTPEVFELVRNMHTLAMKLRSRRMDAGAINLILPEVKIDLDNDGRVSGAHTVDNTESHQVIEEFMLAANEAVAQRMCDDKLFYMRRIHAQPAEAKLKELTNFVQQLGIECDSLENRFEVKRVIEQSESMPEQHAIHFAVLRSMQKAVYSPEEIGHYALNSENYCHFTSPIRRYPDLIIHRMVGDLVDGKTPDADFDRLAMLGKHCSELEKRASDAERDLIKLKLLNFMSDKVGKKMLAVITGVEAFGVFAQGIEIPAEGLIPVANLPSDSYQYDRGTRTLQGFRAGNLFRLGDKIEVVVAVVDPDQRTLEFELVGVEPTPSNVARRSRPDGDRNSRSGKGSRNSSSRNKSKTATSSPRDSKEGKSKESKPKDHKSSNRKSSDRTPRKPKVSRKKKRSSSTDWEDRRAVGRQWGQGKKKKKRKRSFDTEAEVIEEKGRSKSKEKPKQKAETRNKKKAAKKKKSAGSKSPKTKSKSKKQKSSKDKAKRKNTKSKKASRKSKKTKKK
jgi:ribonuclease R